MEDLTDDATRGSSTYAGDFSLNFNLDSSFQEPRFVRPKLDVNTSLLQAKPGKSPTQEEVDRFLYVSLYQSTFNNHTKVSPFKDLEKRLRAPGAEKKTSLYQDTYMPPRDNKNEIKLLDNKSNRTGFLRNDPPRKTEVATLMHLVKGSMTATSYNNDFKNTEAIVEKGQPPSFSSTDHALETRQIVAKAFKYRRY
ncbi:hypothetical protein BC830DRAFT_1225542 [Chytriomyces sp. MP71]|nr:hypothetical protein BC830DRAFT_1225542 [Chytriomyces sp. MP71]